MSSTESDTKPAVGPLFLIEFARGIYAGNPVALRVRNQVNASLWADEMLALAEAKRLGGQVVAWTPPAGVAVALHVLARRPKPETEASPAADAGSKARAPRLRLVPTVAPAETRRPRRGKAAAAPEPAPTPPSVKPTRAPKGPTRDEVTALLAATGLRVEEKSSTHYGDPRGARLVLPRSAAVTRVFLYKMPEWVALAGFKSPEERKALGLGAVTHVAEVSTLEEVRPLVEAVCSANGLTAAKPPKAPTPRRRTRKATPVEGSPVMTTTGEQAPLGEAPTGQVEATTPEEPGPSQTTVEAASEEGSTPADGGDR